jgi:hypothetical protein
MAIRVLIISLAEPATVFAAALDKDKAARMGRHGKVAKGTTF